MPNEGFYSDYTSTGSRNTPGAIGLPVEFLYEDPDNEDFACNSGPVGAAVCDRDGMRSQQITYIQNYMRDFENALDALEEVDSLEGLRARINVDSFIDYLLFTELTKNPDGYRHSTYFYKDRDTDGGDTLGKLTMGPFWDYNIAFGNGYECDGTSTSGWQFVCENPGDGLPVPFWWRKLTTNAEFRERLATRWEQLRADGGAFSTARITAWIDTEVRTLNMRGAADRNFKQWVVLGRQIPPGRHDENITTYDGEINQLKSWITDRGTWMDSNLPSMGNEFMVQGLPDASGAAMGVVGGAAVVVPLVIVALITVLM